ncbi:MAG: hypothetical protein ABSA33_06310, partial [Candidatus Micrarchaeaceae archaeon]
MPDTAESGSLGGAVLFLALAILAWIYGLQFLTAILTAVAGALLTFYLSVLQQKKVWKREIAIANTDKIYGPLYVDMWHALQAFSLDEPGSALESPTHRSELWPEILRDYRYRVIDKNLRKQLDDFYRLLDECSSLWVRVTSKADSLLMDSTRELSGGEMVNAIWSAYGILANGQRTTLGGFGPTTTLAQGREVMKNLRANLPDATSYGFSVQFTFKDGSSKTSDLD